MTVQLKNVSRRKVLQGMGVVAGLAIAAPVLSRSFASALAGKEGGLESSVYLILDEDGTVNINIHRVEIYACIRR